MDGMPLFNISVLCSNATLCRGLPKGKAFRAHGSLQAHLALQTLPQGFLALGSFLGSCSCSSCSGPPQCDVHSCICSCSSPMQAMDACNPE